MPPMTARPRIDYGQLSDLELAERIAVRDAEAVRLVTQRNNQRLYRLAWSILKNRAEAEDAVQGAYLNAFAAIGAFRGGAALSTWLSRIVINEALQRRRKLEHQAPVPGDAVVLIDEYRDKLMGGSAHAPQDSAVARQQIRAMLERAVARLPDDFRLVFVLREIEGSSVEETAEALGVAPATVKTRHLRARRRLQAELGPELKAALHGTFPFLGGDCEALSERVVGRFCGPVPQA